MHPSSLVTLRGGPAVPEDVLQLAWRLAEQGVDLQVNETGRLLVGPRSRITDADRQAIREHKQMLTTVVKYCDEVIA